MLLYPIFAGVQLFAGQYVYKGSTLLDKKQRCGFFLTYGYIT